MPHEKKRVIRVFMRSTSQRQKAQWFTDRISYNRRRMKELYTEYQKLDTQIAVWQAERDKIGAIG